MKTSSNASETLHSYLHFAPNRDLRADREKGRQDGLAEHPHSEQTGFCNYELTIIHEIKSHLNRYKRWVREEYDEVRSELQSRRRMRDDVYRSQRDDKANDLASQLDELSSKYGPNSVQYQAAAQAHEDARRRLTEQEDRLRRPPRMHLRRPKIGPFTPYVLCLIFLALIETPVNMPVFQTVFDQAPIFALIAAVAMGVVLVFLAHLAGMLLSRISDRTPEEERGRKRTGGLWVAAILILIVGLATIAVVATGRFDPVTQAFQDAAAILQGAPAAAAAPPVVQQVTFDILGLSIPRDPLILFLFTLTIFIVGVTLSFFRHDPNRDYEGFVEAEERTLAALIEIQRQWENERQHLVANLREDINAITKKMDEEQRAIDRADNKLEALDAQYRQSVEIVKEVARARINAYQEGNQEMRHTRAPTYFGERGMAHLDALLQREMGHSGSGGGNGYDVNGRGAGPGPDGTETSYARPRADA
jgi:hypothetical protein